ncbi:hypothetical protein SANTM175S_00225 [Streptomyces antimycoticus]
MTRKSAAAAVHGMSDETWKRHANPWSVWTRFAAIPAFELAVWSRQWLGWWCLAALLAVVVRLAQRSPVQAGGAHQLGRQEGIYGEQLHVDGKVPAEHKTTLNWLIASGLAGFALIA